MGCMKEYIDVGNEEVSNYDGQQLLWHQMKNCRILGTITIWMLHPRAKTNLVW